jgi:hypothetical protein
MELPFDEAMKMVYNGEIKDAITIMLLLHAKITNWFKSKIFSIITNSSIKNRK